MIIIRKQKKTFSSENEDTNGSEPDWVKRILDIYERIKRDEDRD